MIAALFALAAATAGPPLAPEGQWVVSYSAGDCTLSRGFGDPARPITFGFKPAPTSVTGEPGRGSAVLPVRAGAPGAAGQTIMLTV